MKAPLGSKRTISTWLDAGRYNGIKADSRPWCGGLFGSIGVFVYLAPYSRGTQRGHSVCMGGGCVCDISHWIERKVLDVI